MAEESIQGLTVKVGLDDNLFTQGVAGLNKSMAVLKSEFNATSANLKNFGSSTDQLKAKSEYLANSMELQRAKITALRDAYEKSKAQTGEFSNATQNLSIKLNNAISSYSKTEASLKNVDAELKKTNDDSKKITFKEFANNTSTSIEGARSKIATLRNAFIGITATLAGAGGLIQFTEGAIQAGDNAYKLSQKLHVSTTEAAGLNKMLSIAGVDAQPVISTFTKLDKAIDSQAASSEKSKASALDLQKAHLDVDKATKNLNDTMAKYPKNSTQVQSAQLALATANEKLQKTMGSGEQLTNATAIALDKYGVKLTDAQGKLLPIPKQLDALAAGYKKASDAGNEEAFTADILGAKGQQLIPLLENYTEAKNEAAKVKGIGIDPEQAHQTAEELKVLKLQVAATGGVMAKALIPVVQEILPPLIKLFQNLTVEIKAHKSDLDNLIKTSINIGEALASKVMPVLKAVFDFTMSHETVVRNLSVGVAALWGVLGAGKGIVGIFTGINKTVSETSKFMDNFTKIGAKLKDTFNTVKNNGMLFINNIKSIGSTCVETASKMGTFIAGIIKSGAEAVVSGGKIAISFIGNIIKTGAEAVIAGAKIVGNFIASLVTTGAEAVASGAKIAASFIANIVATGVQSIIAAGRIGLVTAAQWLLNAAMAANPIGLVVIGLAALGTALVVAYNKSETFRNIVNGAFNSVVNTAEWVVGGVVGAWDRAWSGIQSIGARIKSFLSGIFDFKLPHIPVPHFDITGQLSLVPPSVPHIEFGGWYAKGGIFSSPQVVGVGDATSPEAVVPLDRLQGFINNAVQKNGDKNSKQSLTVNVVLQNGKTIAEYIIDDINELQSKQADTDGRNRGYDPIWTNI